MSEITLSGTLNNNKQTNKQKISKYEADVEDYWVSFILSFLGSKESNVNGNDYR